MQIKKVICLSHTINEKTPIYGGGKGIILKSIKSISKGHNCNTMHLSFPNHIGTHLDYPLHFIEDGASVTGFKPKEWIFSKIALIDIDKVGAGFVIVPEAIKKVRDSELVLLRTGFEKLRHKKIYWKDSPALDFRLADFLKQKCPSLRAVGIDFISISKLNNRKLGRRAHRAFLRRNILLLEDMKLSVLKKIPDLIVAAPLLIENLDASPCNVIGIYN